MYFYIHKIYTNENEQTQLLEMCGDARICLRNGKCFHSLILTTHLR